jgi:tetratricopeptide (TPR) repeat protein
MSLLKNLKNLKGGFKWESFLTGCTQNGVHSNPNKEEALVSKGVALIKSGKQIEAITYFDKVLEINPNSESAWYNKGVALAESKKYDEAVKCYDKALEINPNSESAWYNRACLYSIIKEKEKALYDLRRAIEFDTSNKEMAKNDESFEILWGDEDFKKLVS